MVKKGLLGALALTMHLFTSCGLGNDIYGVDKPMKVVDKNNEEINHVWISRGDTPDFYCYIIGGIGDNYEIEVKDTSVVWCTYNLSISSYIPGKMIPTHLHIHAKNTGNTIISITDLDVDQTLHIDVNVTDTYAALTILESEADGYEDNMLLAFRVYDGNDYRLLKQNGEGAYITIEQGTYEFGEYRKADWELTLISEGKETVWHISDADNNKDSHKSYDSDVVLGLRFPRPVYTKWQFRSYYPTLFRFTDAANSDRTFITGRAETLIPDRF